MIKRLPSTGDNCITQPDESAGQFAVVELGIPEIQDPYRNYARNESSHRETPRFRDLI